MKNILLNLNADLGMDCMGCGHSFDDGTMIQVSDEDALALAELAAELDVEEIEGEDIWEHLPELYDRLESVAYTAMHNLMVIQGWEEYGWTACCNYIDELMEEDIANGDFVFDCPEDLDEEDEYAFEEARQEAWEEAEAEKMGAMSTSERANYLEERYGLGTDISDLDFSWSVSLED